MARRKTKSDGGGFVILFLIVAFLIVVFNVAISALLLPLWIYYEFQYNKVKHVKSVGELISSTDLASIHAAMINYDKANRRADAIIARGKSENISQRQDGMFSERSKRGKELNAELENEFRLRNKYKAEWDLHEQKSNERIRIWSNIIAKCMGLRVAVACYAVVFSVLIATEPSWVISMSGFLNSNSGFELNGVWKNLHGAMFGAVISSLILYFVVKKIKIHKLVQR